MKRYVVCLILLCICLTGCRGWRSDKPPVHLNPNMDFQSSVRSQESPQDIPLNVVPWGNEAAFSDRSERDGGNFIAASIP
mgnify:CR=1 FL=1